MSDLPVVPPANIIQEGPTFFEKIKQLFNYATCGMLYSPPAQVVTICTEASDVIPIWIHKSVPLSEEELDQMAIIMNK